MFVERRLAFEVAAAKANTIAADDLQRESEWLDAGRSVRDVEYLVNLAGIRWGRAGELAVYFLLDQEPPW